MLPSNFDFAMLPENTNKFTLEEVGMLGSSIESVDYAIMSWMKQDLNLNVTTNSGFKEVPVLWQAPERAFQVKHDKELRDDAGALILPLISVERTGITKDPARKGTFQAHLYSDKKDGRSGRLVIARKIVQDKTRDRAVVNATRNNVGQKRQRFFPRNNKKVVIQALSIPIPVYIEAEYKITIRTEFQQQINQLMTPFITRTGQINAFTMKRNGHVYEGFIDQGFTHNNNVGSLGEETRTFTSEITIKVLAYLIGEGESDDRPIVRLDENVVEVSFPQESIAPPGVPNLFGNILK
tara:strand:+ start:1937 stop:2821 length:885 start_codon:yes stop_codon:yes gene_type:complete